MVHATVFWAFSLLIGCVLGLLLMNPFLHFLGFDPTGVRRRSFAASVHRSQGWVEKHGWMATCQHIGVRGPSWMQLAKVGITSGLVFMFLLKIVVVVAGLTMKTYSKMSPCMWSDLPRATK